MRKYVPEETASPLPVFFDPTRSRWTAVKFLSSLVLAGIIGLLSVLLVRIGNGPEVAPLSLGEPAERLVMRQPDTFSERDQSEFALVDEGIATDTAGFFQQPPQP